MRNSILFLILIPCLLCCPHAYGGTTDLPDDSRVFSFIFIQGDDMFYLPVGGNRKELGELHSAVERYRAEISSGTVPVCVDGYSATKAISFIRANRVKSELILNGGLKEENFITKNYAESYTAPDGTVYRDIVVVTLHIPAKPEPMPLPVPEPAPDPDPKPEPSAEDASSPTEARSQPQAGADTAEGGNRMQTTSNMFRGWYAGANIGMPFFWGDFLSTAADKTYIGFSAGLFAGYQFNSWLGVSLSLDYAVNKTGHRDYAAGYLLDPQGMTWYAPSAGSTKQYDELYGRINMFSVGLHGDLNANRLFGRRAAAFPLKLIVSPAVYANTFSPKIYTAADDKKYVEGNHSRSVSLGLGADVAVRYDLNPALGIQIKGTGMWITDNGFDNIKTVGTVKQNAMWGISAGVVWRIDAR